ncbi:hypothetical protein C0Q70_02301 [Pomacea canaliculata]|uniref:Uncharacterized protein n=1 Tax=Pomacea canaliculata TaxID=400727 RepID=A0A2T7PPJ7_POMCA|nr:hypothetical protein C0Q70_02301 [Pomacea canaliculata]
MTSSEKTALHLGSDLDGLIHSLEFENHQYVKRIEKENQKILLLEEQEKEKNNEIARLLSLIAELDEDTKRNHKQLVHNKNTLESLKKSKQLLVAHEDALLQQLQSLQLENKEQQKRLDETLQMYKSIWADYDAKYKSQPLVQQLKEEETRLNESEALCSQSLRHKQLLQKQIQTAQNELDFKDWKRFCVKIAGRWLNTRKMAENIAEVLQENKTLRDKLKETSNKVSEADEAMDMDLTKHDEKAEDTRDVILKPGSKTSLEECEGCEQEQESCEQWSLNKTFTKDRSATITEHASDFASKHYTQRLLPPLIQITSASQTRQQASVPQIKLPVSRAASAISKIPTVRSAVSAILSGPKPACDTRDQKPAPQVSSKEVPGVSRIPFLHSPQPQAQKNGSSEKFCASSLKVPLVSAPLMFSPQVRMVAVGRGRGTTFSNVCLPAASAASTPATILPAANTNTSGSARINNILTATQVPSLVQSSGSVQNCLAPVSSGYDSAQKPMATMGYSCTALRTTSDAGDAPVLGNNGNSEIRGHGEMLPEEYMDSDGKGSQLSSASDSTDNLNLDEPFSPFDIEKHRKILMELKTSPSQLLPFMQHSVSNSGQVHDNVPLAHENSTNKMLHLDAPVFMFGFGNQETASQRKSPPLSSLKPAGVRPDTCTQGVSLPSSQEQPSGSFFNFQSMDCSDGENQGLSILSIFGVSGTQPSQDTVFSFNFREPESGHTQDSTPFSLFQNSNREGEKTDKDSNSMFSLF